MKTSSHFTIPSLSSFVTATQFPITFDPQQYHALQPLHDLFTSKEQLSSDDYRKFFNTRDYVILPPSDMSLRLKSACENIHPSSIGDQDQRTILIPKDIESGMGVTQMTLFTKCTIGGKAIQLDLLGVEAFTDWKKIWMDVMFSLVASVVLSPDADDEKKNNFCLTHFAVSPKLLQYTSDASEDQVPHFDSNPEEADDRISVIIYLSDNHPSTAFPRYSSRIFKQAEGNPERLTTCINYFEESTLYESIIVPAGSVAIFRHSVPHFGMAACSSRTDQPRRALFGILSNSSQETQDEYQYYPYMMVQKRYGNKSQEYANSLLKYAKLLQPLRRMSDEEAKETKQWLGETGQLKLYTQYENQDKC